MKRIKGAKSTSHINWSTLFYYDETSPSGIRWATDRFSGRNMSICNTHKGDVAGSLEEQGYWVSHTNDLGTYKIHRIVWELHNGEVPPDRIINHIDGNRSNNLIENLELTTEQRNCTNAKKYSNNTSGVVGVYFDTKKDRKGVGREYFKASWMELDGSQKTKAYSVATYGKDEAFRLACEFRTKVIAELNSQGAGYTERHGT